MFVCNAPWRDQLRELCLPTTSWPLWNAEGQLVDELGVLLEGPQFGRLDMVWVFGDPDPQLPGANHIQSFEDALKELEKLGALREVSRALSST